MHSNRPSDFAVSISAPMFQHWRHLNDWLHWRWRHCSWHCSDWWSTMLNWSIVAACWSAEMCDCSKSHCAAGSRSASMPARMPLNGHRFWTGYCHPFRHDRNRLMSDFGPTTANENWKMKNQSIHNSRCEFHSWEIQLSFPTATHLKCTCTTLEQKQKGNNKRKAISVKWRESSYQCCEWSFAFGNSGSGCGNVRNWCTKRKQSVTSLLAIQFSRYFFKHVLIDFDASRLCWRQRGHDVDVTLSRALTTLWPSVERHFRPDSLSIRSQSQIVCFYAPLALRAAIDEIDSIIREWRCNTAVWIARQNRKKHNNTAIISHRESQRSMAGRFVDSHSRFFLAQTSSPSLSACAWLTITCPCPSTHIKCRSGRPSLYPICLSRAMLMHIRHTAHTSCMVHVRFCGSVGNNTTIKTIHQIDGGRTTRTQSYTHSQFAAINLYPNGNTMERMTPSTANGKKKKEGKSIGEAKRELSTFIIIILCDWWWFAVTD